MDGERYNLVCFLAQQAAEKALKGFLYFRGADIVWGHSIAELCVDASGFDYDFANLKKQAGALDKFYIPTRYPNGLPGGIPADAFISDDAQSALRIAHLVIDLVASKLSV
jgi:HEPN domain-containing protein